LIERCSRFTRSWTNFPMVAPAGSVTVAAPALPAGLLGLGLGGLAFGLFSGMDALIKWLSAGYPVHQMVFSNGVLALLPVGIWAWRTGGLWQLRTRRLSLHVLRGLCGMIAAFLAFTAFSQMSLTGAYAIIFATPLLITALSVPVLGEQVGWRRWSAILAGFAGVLIMLRPGAETMSLGALAAVGAACASAFGALLVRKLSRTETTAAIAFYSNLTILLGMAPVLVVEHVVPGLQDALVMAAAGLLGGIALIALISAYRCAQAALVAPFQYTQMIWGTLFGLLLFGDLPDRAVVLGASVVAASGLFILYRESALGRRPTASLHANAAVAKGDTSGA
jgi:drug/metabolite transporter (DMT)-like permease